MKKFLLIPVLLILLTSSSKSQILNNSMNFEIAPHELYYNGILDPTASLPGEVVSSVDLYVNNWVNDLCWQVACNSVPCYVTNNDPNLFYLAGAGFSWTQTFDIYFEGWESDGAPHCTYKTGDDSYWAGYASFTTSPPSISQTGARWPSAWYWNENNATGDWILPGSSDWDLKVKTAFRYTNGDDCSNPLDFGTLVDGQIHDQFNSTSRAIEGQYSGNFPLSYTDTDDNPSADVYYKFTITQESDVMISTDHPSIQSFDTHLRLYDNCNSLIASNDDMGAGTLLSEINQRLSPGTYIFQVEGYSTSEGNFYIKVRANSVVSSLSNSILNDNNMTIFPNPAKDFLNISFEESNSDAILIELISSLGNIVKTETFENFGNQVSLKLNGIERGSYFVKITDSNDVSVNKKVMIQ